MKVHAYMKNTLRYVIAGTCAGLINGLLGAGGGLILVPLLISWIKLEQRRAFATSVCIIAPISLVSAISYYIANSFRLSDALPFLIGGLIGGFLGGKFLKSINLKILRKVFALMMIYGGIRSIFL